MGITLKALWDATTALGSFAMSSIPYLRKAKAEREAGQDPYSVPPSLSDEQLDDSLRKLGAISGDDSILQKVLTNLEAQYVRPEHFSKPYLSEWLSLAVVKDALKAMARAAILGSPVPLTEQENAIAAYMQISGENKSAAKSFVFAATAFMKASILGGVKDPALGTIIEASHKDLSAQLEQVTQGLKERENAQERQSSAAVVEHHGADAEADLEAILKRRGGSDSNTLAELHELADKLEPQGIYFGAPVRIKHMILDWIVRLEASQGHLENAESALQRLLAEHIVPSLPAQAWHLVAKGDTDAALRLLRDKDSADARSAIFAILRTRQGPEAAKAFFDELEAPTLESYTAAGWGNIVLCLAGLGEIERGLFILATLQETVFQEWPPLWFISGILNSCMIVPVTLRKNILDSQYPPPPHHTFEGKDADGLRAKAIESFEKCVESATTIHDIGLAKSASFWLHWLRLTDPSTRQDERQKLAEDMTNGSAAVALMPLAFVVNLKFNTAPLWRHINRAENLGGLSAAKLNAKLHLLLSEERFSEAATYIEAEWTNLSKVFSEEFLSGVLIQSYANAAECERAEGVLNEKLSVFQPSEARRLRLMIQERRGNDPTNQALEDYKASGEFIDLLNLVSALKANKRWADLAPFALKKFEHEPNADNAQLYIECLRLANAQDSVIINFLDGHPDLVEQNPGLRASRSWTLLHTGGLVEAKVLNDRLLAERSDANDVDLAINLAIRLGEWDRFPALLDSIWGRMEKFGPDTLLSLASLTAGSTKDRALSLIEYCLEKHGDNPLVLLKISSVAMSMGKDDIAIPAIHKAAELTEGEKSLVWRVHHSEALETLRSMADKGRRMTELFRTAQIPIHWAAHEFNIPLCRMLVAIPKNNKEEPDARRRNPVPAFAGNRLPISLDGLTSLALDLSSAYVLNELNLLPHLFDSLDIIYLSPRFFEALYHEREDIRFHQPSRISAAKPLLQMVRQGKLKIASAEAPRELAEEVGKEIAELLLAAQRDGGALVHSGKFWRVTSFMEEEAQLGEFKDYVASPESVATMLYAEAQITESSRDLALDFLRKVSEGEQSDHPLAPRQPIILDQVSAGYLSAAGILLELANSDRLVFVSRSAVDEWQALVDSEQYSESIVASLESIRGIVSNEVRKGKARFVREARKESDENFGVTSVALLDLFENFADVGAVCIDDRVLNSKSHLQGSAGNSALLICSLDIINMLFSRNKITEHKRRESLHALREWCIASVPLDAAHILDELCKCSTSQDGNIEENAYLKVIREYISRLHISDLLCTIQDVDYILHLSRTGLETITKIWADPSSEIADIHARANWVYDYVMPDAELTLRPIPGERNRYVELSAARILSALLAEEIPNDRKREYAQWIDFKLVDSHRPASRDIVTGVAKLIHAKIEELSAETENENEGRSA